MRGCAQGCMCLPDMEDMTGSDDWVLEGNNCCCCCCCCCCCDMCSWEAIEDARDWDCDWDWD